MKQVYYFLFVIIVIACSLLSCSSTLNGTKIAATAADTSRADYAVEIMMVGTAPAWEAINKGKPQHVVTEPADKTGGVMLKKVAAFYTGKTIQEIAGVRQEIASCNGVITVTVEKR